MSAVTRPKLLLADDSATIRKVVELTFADEGIDVSTSADAESAMLKFVEIQPDIVLVDVGLPGMSGYRICEMIKQDDATRHIPVMLLVGSFEPFDQDAAENACADGFLTKPFHSIRDLVARVWDLLGIEPAGRPVTEETADIKNLYVSSFAKTADIEELDTVEELLGDSRFDDEMIVASYPDEQARDNGGIADPAAPSKDFEWSPESMISETGPMNALAEATSGLSFENIKELGTLDLAKAEIIDKGPGGSAPASVEKHEEASPEFISLVAQRVVEKLSDRIIREIAQEAVPRIAEKLIREALEEDKNSSQ